MVEAPTATVHGNGTPAPAQQNPAEQELARAIKAKRVEGYEVESESDTQAILVMKGRRRWFGLMNSPSVRYEVTVENGSAKSRRLSG